jgi:glycerophosphoryl diester phosphodiesterase
MKGPVIIGHRGAMAYAPENTIGSFRTALEMGAQMLEMDVHLSKDEEVIVIHEETVDKTSTGHGKVSDLTLEKLKTLELKNGEHLPTLAEVLELFKGKCHFNVELKGSNVSIPAYEVVSRAGLISDVLFSSFNGTQLLEIKMKDEVPRIALLCKDKKTHMLAIARRLKAEAVHPNKKLVKTGFIEEAHAIGLKVNVWVVNRASMMKKFLEQGVDGIITDKPDVLKNVITEYENSS